MTTPTSKALATFAAAVICGVQIWVTKGESGIGWFAFTTLIIWTA